MYLAGGFRRTDIIQINARAPDVCKPMAGCLILTKTNSLYASPLAALAVKEPTTRRVAVVHELIFNRRMETDAHLGELVRIRHLGGCYWWLSPEAWNSLTSGLGIVSIL